MKKVLIALDYDPSAERIAEIGYSVAKGMGAQTILLHVVADANYYSDMSYSPIMGFNGFIYPDIDEMIVKDLLIQSHDYLENSKKHLGDETIETVVKEGDYAETIERIAKDYQVDMIVVGTHNRRGLDRMISGNTSETLLKNIKIPLLIIPNKVD